MPRAYNARIVALTIGVTLKWVDNVLSHHGLPGVTRSRQGVERLITDQGVLAIEMVRILTAEVGLGLADAAAMVRSAFKSRTAVEMRFTTTSGVVLHFPVAEIERRLRERLLEAIESVARLPRGRPRRVS